MRKDPWASSNSPAAPKDRSRCLGTWRPAATPARAHAVLACSRLVGWRGASSQHYLLPHSVKAPDAAGLQDRPPVGPRRGTARWRSRQERRCEQDCARPPDSRTEPAKGGAGRGCCSGGGPGRGGGSGRLSEPTRNQYLRRASGRADWRGSPVAGSAGSRRTMGSHCYLPSATSRDVASLGEAAFSSLLTKRGLRTLSSQRDPGGAVTKDKGTPLATQTPALTVRPLLLVPTSRPSPQTFWCGGQADGEIAPPDRAALAWLRVPGPLGSRARGGGLCSVSSHLAPPWSCRQNPESGFGRLETSKLQAEPVGTRTAYAAGFSSPRGGVFFSRGSLKEACLKLGQAGSGFPDARRGASGTAAGREREISPFATPAPAGHSGDRRCTPCPSARRPTERPVN